MCKCGLLGKKLGHSYSPRIHSLLGDYEYLLYEKTEEELENFILNGTWDGLNVTIPYKKEVIRFCDELSDRVKRTGSANTLIRRKDGSIYADNTDVYGFTCLLDKTGVDPAGKKALVLGSGGASASVKAVLEEKGAGVVIISRTGEDNYDNLDRHKDASLIVNTTPVGMYPGNGVSPVSTGNFDRLEAVLDIIYNPARTALAMEAEQLGIPCVTGLHMLVAQAVKSSELFTGIPVDPSRTDEIEKKLSSEMKNIVLIGMPGCGKTTVAEILGELTGRKAVDTDDLFHKETGVLPGKYIEKNGEPDFRKRESQIICEAGKNSGMIISTGGGAVTTEDNYRYLHQNSEIIWIRRNLDELPSDGRPVSREHGVYRLYEQRKALYERFADHQVENSNDPRKTATEILKMMM